VTVAAPIERPLRRQRNFRLAWIAGFVNDTGDWVLTVALPVFVFVETRSGAATAILFVCQLGPAALLGPIAGAVVDRVDLRRCLIATNVAQAVTLLPLLAVNSERIWPAYIVVAAQAALTQLNNPANVSILTRVVTDGQLTRANAALAASASLARLLGAPLGGALVAWGGLTPIVLIDTVSFVLVAVAVTFITADTSPVPDPNRNDRFDLRDGWRVARANPPLASIVSLSGMAQVAQGAFVVIFVAFVVDTLGDDGGALGLIRGTMAIGALIGSALIAKLAGHVDPPHLYGLGLVGMGIVSLAFWNTPTVTTQLWVYVALFSLSGIPGSAVAVGLFTTIQRRSPRHAIGRVTGLLNTAEAVGIAVGSIAAGLLIDRLPMRPLLNAQAGIYLIVGTVVLVHLRRTAGDSLSDGRRRGARTMR
jgi:predicted MFS family arabinose efflux permease